MKHHDRGWKRTGSDSTPRHIACCWRTLRVVGLLVGLLLACAAPMARAQVVEVGTGQLSYTVGGAMTGPGSVTGTVNFDDATHDAFGVQINFGDPQSPTFVGQMSVTGTASGSLFGPFQFAATSSTPGVFGFSGSGSFSCSIPSSNPITCGFAVDLSSLTGSVLPHLPDGVTYLFTAISTGDGINFTGTFAIEAVTGTTTTLTTTTLSTQTTATTSSTTLPPDLCLGKDCSDGNPCTEDQCDVATGTCSNLPVPAGTACDDGDPCTETSTCQGGACVGGPRVCTVDIPNPPPGKPVTVTIETVPSSVCKGVLLELIPSGQTASAHTNSVPAGYQIGRQFSTVVKKRAKKRGKQAGRVVITLKPNRVATRVLNQSALGQLPVLGRITITEPGGALRSIDQLLSLQRGTRKR